MNQADTSPVVARPDVVELGPLTRLGFWPRLLARKFFVHVRVDPGVVEHLRGLSARGSLVYVMRYRSFVDFMLVASILMREGLPLPAFVADLHTVWLRPLREMLAAWWHRVRHRRKGSRAERMAAERERCGRLVRQGQPVLV